jgi:hypothetical protein
MDIELVVKEYRPRLTSFLQTKRTAEDARCFAAACADNAADDDVDNEKLLPLLFSIMSADADHKATYADVSSVARKLTIGILRHPHNDYDLQAVLASYVEKMKVFCAKNLGRSINQTCEELDVKFWTTLWQDMEEGYFDGFMKHILILRIEILQQCGSGSKKYSTSTVLQFFDMEYIKKNMYLKTYHFMSVFEFVRGFINDKIHDVLKPSFNAMCDNFVSETPATTTNETHVRVLRFLIKNMIDYLYLDITAAF